jgi:hypothetical protein
VAPPSAIPPSPAPGQPQPPSPAPQPAQPEIAPFAAEAGGAVGGETVAFAAPALSPGGYLDDAIPKTMFRLRYDNGFNLNRPDRAQFFYATWKELSFHPHGTTSGGVFFDPNARGPDVLPRRVDYQEIYPYFEYALSKQFSIFTEVPTRFVHFKGLLEDNPESERKPGGGFFNEPRGENEAGQHTSLDGLSDLSFGFKAALIAETDRYFTFQLTTWVPTGDADRGLGTGHWTVEPALLLYKRLTDRLVVQGQFKGWIPIDPGPMGGNILNYGVGVGYDVYRCNSFRVTPVLEVLGWTVLDGFESVFEPIPPHAPPVGPLPVTHGVADASGDTIVNIKFGLRTYFGEHSDAYIGYGRAVTGDRWYQDILRLEYRFSF